LFPNPANQYVIAEYNLSDNVSSAENIFLTIWSCDGKIIDQRKIVKSQGQVLINCHNLNSGSYICKISSGKKTFGFGKFVITK
jgi:ABC-type sugar transport system ATPase subunit